MQGINTNFDSYLLLSLRQGQTPYILSGKYSGKYVGNWQYFIGKYKTPFVCCIAKKVGAISELPLLFRRKDYLLIIDN